MRAERSAPTPRRISSRLRLCRHPRLNPQPHLSSSTFRPVLAPPICFCPPPIHASHGSPGSWPRREHVRLHGYTRACPTPRPAHPIWAHRCMPVRPICYDGHAERATHSNSKQKCTHERTWHGTGPGTRGWAGSVSGNGHSGGTVSRSAAQLCFPSIMGTETSLTSQAETLIWLSQSKKKGGMIDARVSCEPRVKSWVMVLSLSATTAAQTQQCEHRLQFHGTSEVS